MFWGACCLYSFPQIKPYLADKFLQFSFCLTKQGVSGQYLFHAGTSALVCCFSRIDSPRLEWLSCVFHWEFFRQESLGCTHQGSYASLVSFAQVGRIFLSYQRFFMCHQDNQIIVNYVLCSSASTCELEVLCMVCKKVCSKRMEVCKALPLTSAQISLHQAFLVKMNSRSSP